MIDRYFVDPKAITFDELASVTPTVRVGDRAAGLRLGVLSDKLVELPEAPVAFGQQDPQDLPGEPW